MTTLIITRGYPASGKTTAAKNWLAVDPDNRARVNRDDLRANLFNRYTGLTYEQEERVTAVQKASVKALLRSGMDVIVDDTNLRLRYARGWADLAVEVGAEFRVWDLDTDVETCVLWDFVRGSNGHRKVGEDVIRGMAKRFRFPLPEVIPSERAAQEAPAFYVPDTSKPAAWLVDIDGTLANFVGNRGPYDLDKVDTDEVFPVIRDLVHLLSDEYHIVYLSGRSDEARVKTQEWLDKHVGIPGPLLMRPAEDRRQDYKVKADLFDEHVRHNYNVIGVLDDRDQVVRMWRSIGLTVLQVADGNF